MLPRAEDIDLVEWLENDPNPIAVIDGRPAQHDETDGASFVSYCNRALRVATFHALFSPVLGLRDTSTLSHDQQEFLQWLMRQTTSNGGRDSMIFQQHIWSSNLQQKRWIVVRGVPLPPSNINQRELTTTNGTSETRQYPSTVRCFLSEPLTAHQTFVRDFDWASTPLGPMSKWNSQLIETVSLTLTGTDPAAVFWGTEMTSVYNEMFINIAGKKHPSMMGDSPMIAFAEVWDQFFEPRIQLSRKSREPFAEKALCLLLERLGYPEETYMTFTFLPLLGWSGEVVGFYHTVIEETQQILSRRRLSFLLQTSEVLARAQDEASFWELLVHAFAQSELDTPFAVLYSVTQQALPGTDLDSMNSSTPTSDYCHLEGTVGYPAGHKALLEDFWLEDNSSPFAPVFRASLDSRTATILSLRDETLDEALVEGLEHRGFGSDCNTLAICPLRPTNHQTVTAFLALGLSPRRPYDADYQSFIHLLVKNVSSSLASVVLLEDEKKRGLNNAERAAYESAQLAARLEEREIENQVQEHKFMVMAHQVPVGIFDLSPAGDIKFCNQAWYEMTGQGEGETSMDSWSSVMHDDDQSLVQQKWTTMAKTRLPVSFEGRFKKPRGPGPNHERVMGFDFTWYLARLHPVLADDGSIVNVIGSFTDITFQKVAMAQQVQQVEEAIEAKRQQENFMDMTSHEMRNPLNAMLLCAQELSANLQNMHQDMSADGQEALASSIDAADTILYCGRHQRRIIDDVLTLSKLDAKLLQITPIEVQPVKMAHDTLKLFESEIRAQGIETSLEVADSFNHLEMANVMLDPSRVVQILVNFIANAIKFTKTETVRQMQVIVGASREQPTDATLAAAHIQLIPSGGLCLDPTTQQSWGTEEPLYLQFIVRDTGPGISNEDMLQLFGRFTQTRPKTHAHYGGSGLGLWISQQLAELQGGRVGIASEVGTGTSFYFHVKARRARPAPLVKNNPSIWKTPNPTRGSASVPIKSSTPVVKSSVLVVEDNLVNQKVLKRQLEKLGFTVYVANHGEEALAIIRQSRLWKGDRPPSNDNSANDKSADFPLHIILMDIEMPVMNGREAIVRIREYEKKNMLNLPVPVVALTANARPEQIRGAMEYGFDEVIPKPFQLAQVVDQIERFSALKAL